MDSDNITPEAMIKMSETHRKTIVSQIEELERRIIEMEGAILKSATRMHQDITEKLNSIFADESVYEFDVPRDGTGEVRLSGNAEADSAESASRDDLIAQTLVTARDQLRVLSETIDEIQLAR